MPQLSLLLMLWATSLSAQNLRLPAIFSEGAVLQTGDAPVFGKAAPGSTIQITLGEAKATAQADAKGAWQGTLKGLQPSDTGRVLVVIASSGQSREEFRAADVIIGEVWVGSGQSNMDWTLSRIVPAETIKAYPSDASLRWFRVAATPSGTPADDIKGRWIKAGPETAANISAVGYFFGSHLRTELRQPVGIIVTSIGGTRAEAWGPRGMYDALKGAEGWQQREDKSVAARAEKKDPKNPPVWSNGPHMNWNGMVHPFVGYGIRGALWYQGESNAANAKTYDWVLGGMIRAWHKAWGREFPFLIVQLPRFRSGNEQWPALRAQQQVVASAVPGAMMTVNIDLGEEKDIHPRDKKPVGQRLALLALERVYAKDIVGSPPAPLRFTNSRGGLSISFDRPVRLLNEGKGFEMLGKDGSWLPAIAEVKGSTVTLRCEGAIEPPRARYAWKSWPEWSLVSDGEDRLPVAPWMSPGK
jgi:sialate O-acetylesterase